MNVLANVRQRSMTAPSGKGRIRQRLQCLDQKAAGRGENGDFRVPERNVLGVHEHRNAGNCHLQTGMVTIGTDT